MDLQGVRKMLVKQSGRYDLVTDGATMANNPEGPGGGADFYIQEGQKFLDRKLGFGKEEAEISVSIATGDISAVLSNIRAIRGVSIEDPVNDQMVYLERESLKTLRQAYGDEKGSLSSVERGRPSAWGIGFLRDNVVGNSTTQAEAASGLKLIFMPPADRNYTLSVQALAFSPTLSATTDVSYWTVENPQVLVWAALYMLEVSYRNSQGAQAYLASIMDALEDIDNDMVEQEIVEQSQPGSIFRFIKDINSGWDRHVS